MARRLLPFNAATNRIEARPRNCEIPLRVLLTLDWIPLVGLSDLSRITRSSGENLKRRTRALSHSGSAFLRDAFLRHAQVSSLPTGFFLRSIGSNVAGGGSNEKRGGLSLF